MKKIGLIGGMGWESSAEYYRILNRTARERLVSSHSSECVMYSFDFGIIDQLQHEENWMKLSELLVNVAITLEKSGAEILLLCTNTMHLLAEDIEKNIRIPFLHIVDRIGREGCLMTHFLYFSVMVNNPL